MIAYGLARLTLWAEQNSKIEKAFLFDVRRKIAVATDSSPVGLRGFELASETLDMMCDLAFIYREHRREPTGPSSAATAGGGEGAIRCASGEMQLSNGIFVGLLRVNDWLWILYLYNGDGHPSQTRPDLFGENLRVSQEAILQLLQVSVASHSGTLSPSK